MLDKRIDIRLTPEQQKEIDKIIEFNYHAHNLDRMDTSKLIRLWITEKIKELKNDNTKRNSKGF